MDKFLTFLYVKHIKVKSEDTRENRLNTVQEDGEGQDWREVSYLCSNGFTCCENV